EGLVHLEVVAPAGEFEPVVAEVAGESADLLQGQVGPLAGEQREVARHPYPSSSGGDRRVDGVLLCALLHGGQDALHLESVGEGGIGGAALGDRVDQVARLVHEGVLVAEAVARRPPGVQVAVVRFGDEDAAEPSVRAGLGAVVVRQLVEPFQVDGQRAALAVDVDAQGVLASGGVPGGLEGGQGAGGEAAGEQGGVVDADLAGAGGGHGGQAAGRGSAQRPVPYEGLGQGGHPGQVLAGQVLGEVDDVRPEVAERAG